MKKIITITSLLPHIDPNNGAGSGIPLEIVTQTNAKRGEWQFHYEGDGYYSIKNYKTGYYITDTTGAAVNNQAKPAGGFTDFQL